MNDQGYRAPSNYATVIFQVLRDLQIVAGENIGVRICSHSAVGYSSYSGPVQILFLSMF